MKPGRELDALIAENVMGWELYCYESDVYASEPGQYDDAMTNDGWAWDGDDFEGGREAHKFSPSTDISCAWEVVAKLAKTHWMTLDYPPYYGWQCNFRAGDGSGNDFMAEAESAPKAICLAALKILGIE